MIRNYLLWGWVAWSVLWMGMGVEQASEAADIGGVRIHGFGGWAYGQTDNENSYLMGNEDGNYEYVNFSLNLNARPSDRLSVYAQTGFTEKFRERETGIDYAFAEWYVNDALSIRAGKVKAPFLLYTEIYDVGTLRPFFDLPPGIYQQFTAEAYKGVGLTGTIFSSSEWDIEYDLYGGELKLLPQRTLSLASEQPALLQETPILDDLTGGRILVRTPLEGMNIVASMFRGNGRSIYHDGKTVANSVFDDDFLVWGLSAEYVTEAFGIRTEYVEQQTSDAFAFHAIYVEPSYKLTEHWQIAAHYEWLDAEASWLENYHFPESFLDHQDFAIGINYWFNTEMVAKAAYHAVRYNRCAQPDTLEDFLRAVQQGKFEERTNVFIFGVQFSF